MLRVAVVHPNSQSSTTSSTEPDDGKCDGSRPSTIVWMPTARDGAFRGNKSGVRPNPVQRVRNQLKGVQNDVNELKKQWDDLVAQVGRMQKELDRLTQKNSTRSTKKKSKKQRSAVGPASAPATPKAHDKGKRKAAASPEVQLEVTPQMLEPQNGWPVAHLGFPTDNETPPSTEPGPSTTEPGPSNWGVPEVDNIELRDMCNFLELNPEAIDEALTGFDIDEIIAAFGL